jgi:hypothetical protein
VALTSMSKNWIKSRFAISLCALLWAGLGLTVTFADTVTLMPVGDAEIQQHSPDLNLGNGTSVVSGALGASARFEIRRALFQFDLSGIPAGSTINSVSLRVSAVLLVPLSPANSTFDLRRLLASWTETEVTWNSRLSTGRWETPGASGPSDSVPIGSSSVFVTGLGSYTFPSTPALVADVQAWVNNPGNNFGWLLLSEAEATPRTARHFATREDALNTPRLVINFSPPAALGIVLQPQDQTVMVGGTAAFSVTATGTPPLAYQWRFDGTPIPGATNDTLVLNNVQTNAAGQYAVTVSNPSGTTNSLPATLTVAPLTPEQPVVSIISPTNGALFPAGGDVLVTAEASESNGTITQVEFFLNTNSVGTSTNLPFSVLLTNLPAGTNLLQAIATDAQQLTATSSVVRISVVGPPSVVLTLSPADTNLPLGLSITNTATVTTGGTKVTNVQFFEGAMLLGEVATAPFRLVWQPAEARLYSLSAVAIDEFGLSGTSAPVLIRIHEPESIAPRIAITNGPANFARLTSNEVALAGTASDNVGLDHVEYQVSSGPFLESTGQPLPAEGSSNWLANVTLLPGKNSVRVRSVDLAGNSSAVLTRFYTYTATAFLIIQTNGAGTVLPDLNGQALEIGKVYRLKAHPESGFVFAGWEGVRETNSAALSFVMESNLTLVANFVLNPFLPAVGAYTGVFFNTNDVLPESSGLVTLQLARSGLFSGKLGMRGTSYSFRGQLGLTGAATIPVARRSLAPALLSLNLDISGDSGQLSGFVTNIIGTNVVVSQLLAAKNSFNSQGNPAPPAGPLGFVLLSGLDEIGRGTASIAKDGTVRIQGRWSNNLSFALSSVLFQHGVDGGNVPFYLSYRSGTEIIIGLPHFGFEAGDISGELSWVRSGTNGFSKKLEVMPSSP